MNKKYRDLIELILSSGYEYEDPNRKGVKRCQINSYQIEHNLIEEGFPFITAKTTYPTLAFKELQLFMSGETDIREYWKIGVNFWDKDWMRFYDIESREEGLPDSMYQLPGIYPEFLTKWGKDSTNQIEELINTLKYNPMATKKTVTMWDPSALGVLSACHWAFEAIVRPLTDAESAEEWLKGERVPKYALTIKWHQHSVDTFLGLPMNISYYAGLCVWLAARTGMVAEGIIGDLSNVHIYDNAIEASEELFMEPLDQETVFVKYNLQEEEKKLSYPNYENFEWDKSKVVMGKKYNVPMLTYSK